MMSVEMIINLINEYTKNIHATQSAIFFIIECINWVN